MQKQPARRFPFLTAHWRHVLMLNYEVDPAALRPHLPAGTELDLFEGRALASVVGFRFEDARVLGVPVPLHRHFDEVNLRFYVRPAGDETGARRGVVFVKEIVPLPAVAALARWLYKENYVALPMRHTLEREGGAPRRMREAGLVEYSWRFRGKRNRLGGLAAGEPQPLTPGSEEAFIAEHYWGYTRMSERVTGVYEVAHAPWRVQPVEQPYLLCDIVAIYGAAFEPFLHRRPRSAFLAEGSPVAVYPGKRIRA